MNDAISDSQASGELYCPSCERNYPDGVHCPQDGTRLVRLKTAVDPLLGRNLDGRYTIVEKLGQGGMGSVYRGTQHSVGREVAIKVISAHLVSDRDAIKRFLREAKLASRLSHPNAVAVLEFGQTDDGLLYLVMELVTGRTLDAVIKREGVLRPDRIVRIGSQVCDALEGAHALQIVHRDLKPANIMLLSQGRDLVKVLDFGLAKSVAPDQATTTMTNAGALLGTPAYMPPELALGGSCDGRADLYSLGVILYLLGSGHLPFMSESPHELVAMHGHEKAPPMTGVPPGLAAVIDRLLEKNPDDRFQSATETREALEAAFESRMSTPPPAASWNRDTNPSLGPFPASPDQYAHMQTPVPGTPGGTIRRSATELDRLVSSDTIAAPPVSSLPGSTTAAASLSEVPAAAPPRSRRGVFAMIGLLVAAAVAVALVVGLKKSAAPATGPAAPAPSAGSPAPEATATPSAPAPAPEPAPVAAPVAAPAATPTPVAAPPPEHTTSAETAAVKSPKVTKTKTKGSAKTSSTSTSTSTSSVKTTFKPLTTGINTQPIGINPTKTPTSGGTGSGSGKVAPPPF